MKLSKRLLNNNTRIISGLAIIWIFVCFLAILFISKIHLLLKFSFFINGCLITFMLTKSLARQPFSLQTMHALYCFMFLWIAPILQLISGFETWGFYLTEEISYDINTVVFLWLVFFFMGAELVGKNKVFKHKNSNISISPRVLRVFTFINIAILILMLVKNGFIGLLRTELKLVGEETSSSIALLVEHCVTAFVTFTTIFSIKLWKNSKRHGRLVFINLLCLCIAYFPTSLSRYAAGSIYVCVLLNFVPFFMKKHRFFWAFAIGLFFIFPVLDLFRHRGIGEVGFESMLASLSNIGEYFVTGAYDSFLMIGATLKYVESFGLSFGNQLLGSILFFVPRSIWSTKPISTGAHIADAMDFYFDNISTPLPAEAYIDFGIMGMIVIALLIGYFIRRVDNTYWTNDTNNINYLNVVYCYVVPFFVFMCRGSLLSTWAYLAANLVVVAGMCFIFKKFK